jgi:hypothetical protein
MILLYGISPHWSKSAIKKERAPPPVREKPWLALFSTCPVPLVLEQIALVQELSRAKSNLFYQQRKGSTRKYQLRKSRIPAPRWVEIIQELRCCKFKQA